MINNNLINLENVFKIYLQGESEVRALNGVDLSIREGEFVAIVGASGSGKSTLMNMIGCLDSPTYGSYTLNGENVSAMNDKELSYIRNRKIGFIFQGFNLIPGLTAIENVELPLIYRKENKKDRMKKSRQALERVSLENRIDHCPNQLSGGQQQRVAIARAIAGRPDIILADEPTGNLDTKSGTEVMDLLRDLNNTGITIVLITHDMNVALQASRIIRISDGRIASDL